jgi:predicted transcriptional regulator YheO
MKMAETTVGTERDTIMRILAQIVEPLSHVFSDSEVVLQDLAKLPNSIVAIAGSLTGRKVGDPATDVLLKQAVSGEVRTNVNYRSQLADGRQLRSTTIAIKDSKGTSIAALCINSDVDVWVKLETIAQALAVGAPSVGSQLDSAVSDLATSDASNGDNEVTAATAPSAGMQIGAESAPEEESFVRNVEDLSELILSRAIGSQGVAVELMQKTHKMAVIRQAQEQGFFMMRDAVDTIAQRLGISRFTVYNYLKEIEQEEGDAGEVGE